MKKVGLFSNLIIFLIIFSGECVSSQNRKEIDIPDILGYQTLKCDLHMHTVFSDGDVWPTVRVQEAWQEGLDVIAITDHIEYLPHSQDISTNHNRGFEIAEPLANQLELLLIHGTEITRQVPPGHLTALFIDNANLIEREDWWEACVEAKEQGGFIYWSHPGQEDQQPEQVEWSDEHSRLLEEGMLNGIEIYTKDQLYPEALSWANERNITILGNSDLHAPSGMTYDLTKNHRPITLVFASAKSNEGVQDALTNLRTAVYFNDTIISQRRFLAPLFSNSVEFMNTAINLKNHEVKQLQIHNNSDITYTLKKRQPSAGFSSPDEIILEAHRTVSIELTGISDEIANMDILKMYYNVTNMLTPNKESLTVNIDIPNK